MHHKVFSVDKIREADQFTIQHEPIASIDLMERASRQISEYILTNVSKMYSFLIVCGAGNNGGDGLAVARMLMEYGYKCQVYLAMGEEGSEDFNTNLRRLKQMPQVTILTDLSAFETTLKEGKYQLIDALFGSGLSRPIEGDLAKMVDLINSHQVPVIAIDMPSGLFADKHTSREYAVIKAHTTLSLQFMKLAFFMPENEERVGQVKVLNIGLSPDYITNTATPYFFVKNTALPQLSRFAHKGTRGRIYVVAGGYGRMGAAILASKAAIHAGAGLVSLQCSKHTVEVAQASVPELLIKVDQNKYELGEVFELEKQDAVVVGPALGFANKSIQLFEDLIQKYKGKLVIDADAISMLSKNKELLKQLTNNTILTPHLTEFDRLFGNHENHDERLKTLREKAKQYQINILLKGHFSVLCTANGTLYFNSTGNAGMAKGGSGDVLAGMLAAYLNLYPSVEKAAIAAMYIHGLSGDICQSVRSNNTYLPTDLIENLHLAEKKCRETQ